MILFQTHTNSSKLCALYKFIIHFYTGYIFWRCGYISGWVNRGYIFWRGGYISGWVRAGYIFRRGYIFGYEVPQKCSHLQNWLHFLVRIFGYISWRGYISGCNRPYIFIISPDNKQNKNTEYKQLKCTKLWLKNKSGTLKTYNIY